MLQEDSTLIICQKKISDLDPILIFTNTNLKAILANL